VCGAIVIKDGLVVFTNDIDAKFLAKNEKNYGKSKVE